jgi:helicase required for RNAi-mediated heterochromatin assembly 1
VEFSYERAGRKIRWCQSKRLQQGTVVALSPRTDGFKTICKVAVVAARPQHLIELNPPQLDLFWATPRDAVFDPAEEYVMIEARTGYFEANRHMLVALQKIMFEKLVSILSEEVSDF